MAAKEHLAREEGASQMPPLPVDIDHQLANQILPAPDTTARVGVKQAAATAGKSPAKGAKGARGLEAGAAGAAGVAGAVGAAGAAGLAGAVGANRRRTILYVNDETPARCVWNFEAEVS